MRWAPILPRSWKLYRQQTLGLCRDAHNAQNRAKTSREEVRYAINCCRAAYLHGLSRKMDTSILTKAELAQELRCSQPNITKLIARGMPVRPDGKVDLERSCRWLCDNTAEGKAYQAARMWLDLLDD
jgi:hypothetical protein